MLTTYKTDIPLRHPSEIRRKPKSDAEPLISSPTPTDGREEEVVEDDPDGDFREEVFDTIMLTVPFTFLFILLHV